MFLSVAFEALGAIRNNPERHAGKCNPERSLKRVGGCGGTSCGAREEERAARWPWGWQEGSNGGGRWKLFTNLIVRRAFVLRPYCSTLYMDVLLRPIVAALAVQRN